VKRLLLVIAFGTIAGGVLSASSVIDCSGNSAAVNSCYASKLPSFTTQLDWAVFGSPDGTIHNGVWTAPNVLAGLDVSVSGQNLVQVNPVDEGLRLAYNLGTVFFGSQWTLASSIPAAGYTFAGHFNETSNPSAPLATIQADPSTHLLGLALNGASANRQMLIDFTSGVATFGFFASSEFASNFDLRVQVFAGAGGTGSVLSDETFSYTGVGGQCSSMLSAPFQPTGCNDAPFIYGSGFLSGQNGTAMSVVLSTTDSKGFYISNLYLSTQVPEPGSIVLCGIGMALLVLGTRKRWRRDEQ
jgi:hypothetical protein